MTEYDAFGNPVEPARPTAGLPDEPPLVVEQSATPSPLPVEPGAAPATSRAEPAATPTPPRVDPPAATPTFPPASTFPPAYGSSSQRSRRGLGCVGVPLGLFLVFGLPALIGVLVYTQVNNTVDSVSRSFSHAFTSVTTPNPTTTADPEQPPPAPPTGLSSDSLVRRANFAAALRDVRRAGGAGGRPFLLRVEAARVDAQVVRPDGRTRVIIRPWNGKAQVLTTLPNTRARPSLTWARVDPAAPQRLYAAVRNGSDRDANQLNYAVLLADPLQWSAFRAGGGVFYVSGLSGRDARRAGG